MSMNTYEYLVDVAFSDTYDTLGESLEALAKKCGSAWVRVLKYQGPGGGWPELHITIDRKDVLSFCEWYGGEGATPESLKADHDLEPFPGDGHPGLWD